MSSPEPAPAAAPPPEVVPRLSAVLLDSLRELVEAGRAEAASVLAGRACAALRHDHIREWQRFNALLHRLSSKTGPVGNPAPKG